jgi:hypothetical protein
MDKRAASFAILRLAFFEGFHWEAPVVVVRSTDSPKTEKKALQIWLLLIRLDPEQLVHVSQGFWGPFGIATRSLFMIPLRRPLKERRKKM